MLSSTELKLIAGFLDELGDRFGTDGCNDFELSDTPVHRALLEAAVRTNSDNPDEWDYPYQIYHGKLLVTNSLVVGHLQSRVEAELNG